MDISAEVESPLGIKNGGRARDQAAVPFKNHGEVADIHQEPVIGQDIQVFLENTDGGDMVDGGGAYIAGSLGNEHFLSQGFPA